MIIFMSKTQRWQKPIGYYSLAILVYVTYELIVQFGRCSSSFNLGQQLTTMRVTGIFARVIIFISVRILVHGVHNLVRSV